MHMKTNVTSMLGCIATMVITAAGCSVDSTIGENTANDESAASDENTAEASQAEVVAFSTTQCPYTSAQVGAVNKDRTLIIRDTTVVDDPCRTDWSLSAPSCATTSVGRWTFWHLMDQMKGSTTAPEFVIRFLELFRNTSPVNTFAMQDRSLIQSLVIDPWKRASGCAAGPWSTAPCAGLRKDLAPFRLLAIVNRADLRSGTGPVNDPYSSSSAGEGRFIFGFLDATGYLDANNQYNGLKPTDLAFLKATVILEYGLPTTTISKTPQHWANDWMALNSIAFGPTFNNALQTITNNFTLMNLDSSKPNGSAINQVRTDELDFDPTDPTLGKLTEWEMREHKLTCTSGPPCGNALIQRSTVTNTPDNSFGFDINTNNSTNLPASTLSDFLQDTAFGPRIEAENFTMPLTFNGTAFLGASSRQGKFSSESQTWVNTAQMWSTSFFPTNSTIRTRRRLLGLGTCNGCHYNETQTNQLHVDVRDVGNVSALSGFLNISITSSGNYSATDPVTQQTFKYNEPRRRACELLWLKDGHAGRLTTSAGR